MIHALDAFADQIEDLYANAGNRPRHRKSGQQRARRRAGWTWPGPSLSIAELIKSQLGRSIPIGDNVNVAVPHSLTWTVDGPQADHTTIKFHTPVSITVDRWINWHIEWEGFEDRSDRIVMHIKPKMGVFDSLSVRKDWSSP